MSSLGVLRNIYRFALNSAASAFGAKRAKIFDARLRFGRKLDLDNPKSLADKVSWIELNTDQSLQARCTDKYAVREYVVEKGLGVTLVPLVGGPWTSTSEIDIDGLPNQFVLKATHGCEMNYICKDKSQLDIDDLFVKARQWLRQDYSRSCIEPHYRLVPHRLYAEEYIGGFGDVVDYKFHCLNGEPRFVLVCSNRETGVQKQLYDVNWNLIEGMRGKQAASFSMLKPSRLNQMLAVARTLSGDFDFVRVDLYQIGELVLFGELTFSPASGVFPNFTDTFIAEWGEKLHVRGLE